MPNTYTQLDIQLVFAVKGRQSLVHRSWKDDLYRYITGIVQNHGHKMLRINGMPDHVHIFIGYHPTQLIPKLVEEIKTSSNAYIKQQRFTNAKFSWQTGYGAFSYSRSHRDAVIKYIDTQEEHHRKKTFREEYLDFLQKFEVEYKEEYLFDFQEVYSW
ncbi:MAG: IS200/IS605 family transposase [Saprospiraceae bacterium]